MRGRWNGKDGEDVLVWMFALLQMQKKKLLYTRLDIQVKHVGTEGNDSLKHQYRYLCIIWIG